MTPAMPLLTMVPSLRRISMMLRPRLFRAFMVLFRQGELLCLAQPLFCLKELFLSFQLFFLAQVIFNVHGGSPAVCTNCRRASFISIYLLKNIRQRRYMRYSQGYGRARRISAGQRRVRWTK